MRSELGSGLVPPHLQQQYSSNNGEPGFAVSDTPVDGGWPFTNPKNQHLPVIAARHRGVRANLHGPSLPIADPDYFDAMLATASSW